jgi:hypothetical protein
LKALIVFAAAALSALAPMPTLAQSAPDADVEAVQSVFLARDCVLTMAEGDKAEAEAGLSTTDFSMAVAVLQARGEVQMDPATLDFRLNHKDCT